MLNYQQAKSYYNEYGDKQDSQSYYEEPAFDFIIESVDWQYIKNVYELGSGTGLLAKRLLANHLAPDAHYIAMDISSTMVDICRQRLADYKGQIDLIENQGIPLLSAQTNFTSVKTASFDCILATYVLDLLTEEDINGFLKEAHQLLSSNGYLCLASITSAKHGVARFISFLWALTHRLKPNKVGGCRALSLSDYLDNAGFRIDKIEQVSAKGITSEVVIAKPI